MTLSLKVATYNIHKCVGRDRRFDPDRIVAVLKEIDADVVALQEADQRFGERAGAPTRAPMSCPSHRVPSRVPR